MGFLRNTQDLLYQQKSKHISSSEQNYFTHFALRYPVFWPCNFDFSKNIAPLLIKHTANAIPFQAMQQQNALFSKKGRSYFCTEIGVESGFRLHKVVLFLLIFIISHTASIKTVYFRLISSFVFSKLFLPSVIISHKSFF